MGSPCQSGSKVINPRQACPRVTFLPARLRQAQALDPDRWKALIAGLALLSGFNAWLLVFSLQIGLATAAAWWGLALAGALAGLGVAVFRPRAWPLALAVAAGASAVMRLYFALSTASFSLSALVPVGLATALVVATASAVGQHRELRRSFMAVAVLVGVLVLEQTLDGHWTAVSRQLPHLLAFILLASATNEQPGQPEVARGLPPHGDPLSDGT